MSKVDTHIKNAKTNIAPSTDFVDSVMDQLQRGAKPGLQLKIVAPAFGLLVVAIIGVTAAINNPTTVSAVEQDITEIESLLAEIESGFTDDELSDVEQ